MIEKYYKVLITLMLFIFVINISHAGNNQWTPCTTGITSGLFGAYAIAVSPSYPQIIYFSGGYLNGNWSD